MKKSTCQPYAMIRLKLPALWQTNPLFVLAAIVLRPPSFEGLMY
jgi:hypothetical protein